MRLRPEWKHPLVGFALGAFASPGALLIRVLAVAAVRADPLGDLATHAFLLSLQLIGTTLVFTAAGVVTGRRVARLWSAESMINASLSTNSLTGLYNVRALTDRCRRGVDRQPTQMNRCRRC